MMATSGAAPTEQLKSTRPSIGAATGSGLRPGTLFANRYEVKEVLGMGGMGVVYRAFDRELQEPVAIKTLRPGALADDAVAVERFKQEMRLARKIAHRNVVRTYDLGETGGMYYLTMEYVEGTSLRSDEHTSELQSQSNLGCRLLLEKKKKAHNPHSITRS